MYCMNCGKQIQDGSKFCVHCGAAVARAAAPAAPQQTQQQVYQQPQAVRSMPAGSQVYQQPYAAPYAAPAGKRVTSKWPVSTGVMGILYFVFTLVSFVPYLMYYVEVIDYPEAFFTPYRIIHLLLAIAVPVLFFIHTKKVAFVTAIPMFLMLVMDMINFFGNVRYYYRELLAEQIVLVGLFFVLVAFYVIQMIVRPRSAALPVLYLIFGIIYLIITAVIRALSIGGGYEVYWSIGSIISWFAEIFSTVAYIIAMFSSRKR